MSSRPLRLSPAIVAALEQTGLPYRVAHGSKHWKVYVGDRLATVIRRGSAAKAFGQQIEHHTLRDIRRAAALAKEGRTNERPGH